MSGRSRTSSGSGSDAGGSWWSGEPTGTKDGSNATGKLAEEREARASRWAVRLMLRSEKGSTSSVSPGRRRNWKRPACRLCGSCWPIESTETAWLPRSTVVVMVRSIGASAGVRQPFGGCASSSSAEFSFGRKYSSPFSNEVGWPWKGGRSRVSMRPWSIQRSRRSAGSASRLTWVRARAAPLIPPADVPVMTSTRAEHPVSRWSTSYAPCAPARPWSAGRARGRRRPSRPPARRRR